ncbi:regulatory protein RecX [Candidatus Peregrinibacteria bacterium]|nr:regulatory protein RecX [Candidatus Peregrinibacteria bacterium]
MEHQKILQNIRDAAFKYLGMRNHSEDELRRKLLKKFRGAENEIEIVFRELFDQKLLNDKIFAEEYLRYRTETSPRGKSALRSELRKKGVSSEIIDAALLNVSDEDEHDFAKKLTEQKLKFMSPNLEKKKKKEKLFRFLHSRGIAPNIIFDIFSEKDL